MKIQQSSNTWQKCPSGLIRHLSEKQVSEDRCNLIIRSSTLAILMVGIFLGLNYEPEAASPAPAANPPFMEGHIESRNQSHIADGQQCEPTFKNAPSLKHSLE